MLDNTDALVAILDYIARGAVLVVLWMLRQLFLLDKKFAIMEQEQAHQLKTAELESKKRDAQRREILGAMDKHSDKLERHGEIVLREIRSLKKSSSG